MNPHRFVVLATEEPAYTRLVNSCLFAAVLSALVFESMGEFYWAAGLIGILAATIASSAYLLRQRSLRGQTQDDQTDQARTLLRAEASQSAVADKTPDRDAVELETALTPTADEVPSARIRLFKTVFRNVLSAELEQDYHRALLKCSEDVFHARTYVSFLGTALPVTHAGKLSILPPGSTGEAPSDFVEKVVSIIERLSGGERRTHFEYLLSPSGGFIIRPINRVSDSLTKESDDRSLEGAGSFSEVTRKPN